MHLLELVFKYYGVDWLMFLLITIQIELMTRKSKWAFVFGMLGSFLGLGLGLMIQSMGNIVMNCCFIFFYIRGWLNSDL